MKSQNNIVTFAVYTPIPLIRDLGYSSIHIMYARQVKNKDLGYPLIEYRHLES